MDGLELYYTRWCPYCAKVLRFMDSKGIKIALKDADLEENRKRLVEVGGKNQVPCLFIDGKPMYESSDIIAYMAKRFAV